MKRNPGSTVAVVAALVAALAGPVSAGPGDGGGRVVDR